MKHTLLLIGLLCSGISFSQSSEEEQIRQWQSLHPSTLLISQARYDAMSKEERKLIGEDYILFSSKITLEQLQASKNNEVVQKDLTNKPDSELSPSDSQIIKEWHSTHEYVKLIKQSEYGEFTDLRKQYCSDRPLEILVLDGEFLTVSDIKRYGL